MIAATETKAPPVGDDRRIVITLTIGPPDNDERMMTVREASDWLLARM